MTNVGRRELFVQFQIKNPIIRDDHEQGDNLEDRSLGSLHTGRVQDEIKNSQLLLKSTLVFSVMYRRRGHQSDVENSERTGMVIISEMGVRALHSQTQ